MFGWFERRLNPYPEATPTAPPEGLVAFCWHYSRDAAPWLITMAVLTALISIGEVMLFGFLGSIVDWLATSDPQGFLARESGRLILMGAIVLVGLPVTVVLHSLIIHQTLLGNYPMIARWQMHRYLLRQSLSFFSNEFAGRVATKVMQTSLSIREAVMKLLDVFVYVLVYFIAMIGMVASAEWRLVLPLLVWIAIYVGLIMHFVPKLKRISTDQADARSAMTGRVVDSYTNISTVKLFSHAGREESYAQELFEGAVDALSNRLSGVSGSLTGVAPDAPDEAAPVLSADLRPHPKPLSLQPLEGVSRILVEKSKRRLTVYVGDQVARIWPIALGRDPVGDKTREGDNRTPEGIFRVDRLNGASAYHLSLGLDYPQPKHRAQARALGVSPGGDIMIHGQPNRSPFGKLPGDWTAGCIALSDAEVTQLFAATAVGTVVEIRP